MAALVEGQSASRRKVCDLCFTKKIKCDMLEPTCSNCLLYHVECRTSAVRSRALPPKPVYANPNEAKARGKSRSARLEILEKKLQRVVESTERAHTRTFAECNTSADVASSSDSNETSQAYSTWKFDSVQPSLYYGPSDGNPFLPPLDDIMPIIDQYFNTFNRTLPLFSQTAFMRLVTAWYSVNPKQDRPTWAAILVVTALGLQSQFPEDMDSPDSAGTAELTDFCMRNAQSIMPELVAMDEDLLGVQVILSLALLFHSSGDLRPAAILVGMAATICRRMQLHSSDTTDLFVAEEGQQRIRVFWILYILDKDICLRTKTSPALSDADIDIPMPPRRPRDGSGIIRARDERSDIDIFHLRIDLAQIQGSVYQLLYSSRSTKIQRSERQQYIMDLQTMLDRWYAQIPLNFQIEAVSTTVSDTDLVQLTNMYHSYLLCIISIHGVYSSQAEWMQRVGSLGRAAIQDFAVAIQGPRVTLCTEKQDPPLLSGWKHCVVVARGSMKLFQATTPTESLVWHCSCAHFSALIILLANILISPAHPSVITDFQAATKSLQLSNQLFNLVRSVAYDAIHRVIKDLHKTAASVVDSFQLEQANDASSLASIGDFQGGIDLFSNDVGFLEFRNEDDYFESSFAFGETTDTLAEADWHIS